jgi:5-methylcytosine-specific restriction endonuclease McrA
MNGGEHLDYQKYISSAAWYAKREERRAIDKNRCRTCGISDALEVHHVTYDNFGDEPMSDLITLCKQCHEAVTSVIRARRYSAKDYEVRPIEAKGKLNHVARKRVSLEIAVSDADAQWTTGRSYERLLKGFESYHGEAVKD